MHVSLWLTASFITRLSINIAAASNGSLHKINLGTMMSNPVRMSTRFEKMRLTQAAVTQPDDKTLRHKMMQENQQNIKAYIK
jgi:hypothetical protein